MHFFNKTIGLMAVLCAMPAAFAATARPSIVASSVGTASSRMPTMVVKTSTASSSTSTTTTSSALLANAECIDAYTECIKDADSCGENFEECTTKVLFHGKMPNCLGTLAQCSTSGVNSLFGTSNISALSNIATKNTYGEVTDYTYPTDGSVLGQMITAAAISNRYDTSTCVRRVSSCLRKDNVCGEDFELCTTNKEFRKQRVFCDATLARCQSEGVIELLGSSNRTAMPTASSRIGEMINEGAALAAISSVSTCYKVVEQCFLGACAANPYKCTVNAKRDVANIVQQIVDGTLAIEDVTNDMISSSDVRGYIKKSCLDTIGSNKYCYATFLGNGQMPTNAQLRDEDNQEEIFDEAYSSRMNEAMKAKIADLVEKFDTKAKQKCTETVKSCAMRVCGGGSGPACYAAVFGAGGLKSINARGNASQVGPYDEIKTGCSAIVDTDTYCKYSAANPSSTGVYSYTYINNGAFDVLFPEYSDGAEIDAIGIIAALNSSLATSYNDAAIAQMRKSCENVAKGCIKSMCGSEYANCYRNRTDIISGTYDTGTKGTNFDKSMNKMGGVLDNNIVIGLCLDTVKNASSCEEHLAIQTAKSKSSGNVNGWGANASVRDAWLDANSTVVTDIVKSEGDVETGLCRISKQNKVGKCNKDDTAPCDTVDSDSCVYDDKEYLPYSDYVLDNEAETLLQQVMVNIEKEAQAMYNAKLTNEQHMCLAANNAGGILSSRDIGSTFMWAKLKTANKVPSAYNVNGLKSTQFEASNDLYGSFCRVRVTLQSDDRKIQEAMRNKSWTTAYFAVGDAFTCGSWIPEKDLTTLSEDVAKEKLGLDSSGDLTKGQKWGVAGASVLSAILGGVGTDMLQTEGGLGGLLKTTKATRNSKEKRQLMRLQTCVDQAATVRSLVDRADCRTELEKAMQNLRTTINSIISQDGIYIDSSDLSGVYCFANNADEKDKKKVRDAATAVGTKCNEAIKNLDFVVDGEGENWWTNKNGGRVVIDTLGAGVGAAVGGVTTAQILKANNRAQLTAEQEEWMNNIGRHITCYIGGDEAGSYGDIITTTLE